MHAYALASVAVPVTAALYGLTGLLRRRTAARQRRALDRWAAVLADPYQAVMGRLWPYDTTQAAAARLVLDGLVTVNHRGSLSPSPAASDPARVPGHPCRRPCWPPCCAGPPPRPSATSRRGTPDSRRPSRSCGRPARPSSRSASPAAR
ncbi:hypothetical protein SSAG_06088 [Streptomyces sp. Mg1]|nr:hypothetical protein SSAG_06088 [Streptomyces sp. Mg1]